MAEVKFWEEMNPAPAISHDDKLMLGKGDTGATYYTDFNQIRTFFGLNSNSILSADTTTEWENQDNGLFIPTESGSYVYGEDPTDVVEVDLTEGFTMLKWDGDVLTKILYATRLGTPIKFRISDEEVVIDGDNTVITDDRLKGMNDYPVMTTQLNVTFRNNELLYDSINGTLTILNFKLQSLEEVIVYPDATGGIGGNNNILEPVEARLDKIEQMLAPMLSFARVWWTGGIDTIPAGWVEDEEWRGYTPIHANNVSQIGLTTGQNEHTLTSNQQGTFQVRGVSDRSAGAARNNAWANFSFIGGGTTAVLNGGSGANVPVGPITVRLNDASQPFSLVQRSKYGIWIKYVGV